MIIENLNLFTTLIEEVVKKYIQSDEESMDEHDFLFQEDLDRYCNDLALDRVKFIKHNINELRQLVGNSDLTSSDIQLIGIIDELLKLYTAKMHKCIGCPCREFEHPNCYHCPFLESCRMNVLAYPDECNPSDCGDMFRWFNSNISNILEAIDVAEKAAGLSNVIEYNPFRNVPYMGSCQRKL